MTLSPRPYLQRVAFRADSVRDADTYPFTIAAARVIDTLVFDPGVTFFVGENGSGKSTVIEAIALALGFAQEGGTRNVQLDTAGTASELHQHLTPVRSHQQPDDSYFLRAETFFNLATLMEQTGYLRAYGGSLHRMSHGESFLAVLTYKLQGHGLYIMDEPEAALSPTRQLAALRAIHQLVGAESQFIIATHSPILLAYPGATIYRFDDDGIEQVAYEDTEHYSVTRNFLNRREHFLAQILAD